MKTNRTLKQIRINVLGFTEKEMADKLNMSISDYKKIENNDITTDMLIKVAAATGLPIDTLLNMQKEKLKFEIEDKWTSIYDIEHNLSQFLISHRALIDSESMLTVLKNMIRKPKVAFVGRSDVGKSTLINTLLGNETLPVSWTPTTSIIVYVKHIKDRPSYIKDNVLIFHADEKNELWDDSKLIEKEYTNSYLIDSGDYSLLLDYGARQGSKFDETNAASAVIFLDSDILKNCDLIDMPGYGTGDRDEDDSLLAKLKGVDILVYMSLANAFMRSEDIIWLQNELPRLAPITLNSKYLSPLANLYIVASQAHVIKNGSSEELNYILDEGAKRFETTLSPNYWNSIGQDVNSENFRNRFFTYSTDQESLRKKFEDDLRSLLEEIPQLIFQNILLTLKSNVQERIDEIKSHILSFQKILSDRKSKKKELEEIEAKEPERIIQNVKEKQNMHEAIEKFGQNSINDFASEYNKIVNKDNIVNLIKINNWKKKEEDIKLLTKKLSNLLNEANASITIRYSKEFKDLVDNYIDGFKSRTNLNILENDIQGKVGFNFKASFAGGLAGMAVYGALAFWAASLGNLGAYILVAKGVSLLAALGISVGGTAAAVSAVAAIGGPIVIIVGLAVIISVLVYLVVNMFRGWRNVLANNIIKEYDKAEVLKQYKDSISKYWNDTKKAFNSAAENMEREYEEYLNILRKEIIETNDEEIKSKIELEEKRMDIYSQLINNLTV